MKKTSSNPTEQQKKKTRTVTFQPTDEVSAMLPIGMKITGKSRTKLINDALRTKLPDLIREMEEENERERKRLLDALPPHSRKGGEKGK